MKYTSLNTVKHFVQDFPEPFHKSEFPGERESSVSQNDLTTEMFSPLNICLMGLVFCEAD